jgi:hypothetical protein
VPLSDLNAKRTQMTDTKKAFLSALVIGFGLIASVHEIRAQVPNLEPDRKQDVPVPIVTFDLVWTSAQPAHYAIAVASTGTAAYRSEDTFEKGKPLGDSYLVKFVVTEPTRDRIFELAKQANYFKGDFDYTKNRIANTGSKTLTYREGNLVDSFDMPVKGHENQATYNWSQNPAIQQLTQIFQGIGTTVELGRKLDFERRFDKLGLDAELKRVQEMQKSGFLEQVHVIAPVLKNIANDYSIMHIARERAKQILSAAHAQENGSQPAPVASNP